VNNTVATDNDPSARLEEPFETAIARLAVPRASSRYAVVAAAALLGGSLLAGLVYALVQGSTAVAVLFALALAGTAVLFYLRTELVKPSRENAGRVAWNTAQPEIQRQHLNVEVAELSKVLDVSSDNISDLQTAYIVAEDLALRQIQFEENAPLLRHVSLAGVPFDALLAKGRKAICIETAFLVEPDVRQEKIDAILRKMKTVTAALRENGLSLEPVLMMVLITQLPPEDIPVLKRMMNTSRFRETPVDIDVRFLDFEKLQETYVID
jgi:hypothetical protein